VIRSDRRILTTHVGSLPRPPALRELLVREDRGEPVDRQALARETEEAVRGVVDRQLGVGIDVGNDGEQPRAGFSTYVARRMRGFGGESQRRLARDLTEHPDYAALLAARRRGAARIGNAPRAVAEIEYADLEAAEAECRLFLAATEAHPRRFAERFMTAVSPGTAATILLDDHYGSHARYIDALARELRKEYALVHARGLILQLDCPDLAMERSRFFQDAPLDGFQAIVALHVDAVNRAIEGIPRERVRLHVCWGNYDGPHTHDVPLEAILPLLYHANVGALSLPFASPRHQYEYRVLRRHPLPDGMLLLPGVIDTTTNVVEHPEVVADRICLAAEAVGDPARIIASTDCGFGTFAGSGLVADSVVWMKLAALVEGAALATRRLWR
jgi:5-methyltetrahydropteroyltriglutamate--homocysteine methyltransferase